MWRSSTCSLLSLPLHLRYDTLLTLTTYQSPAKLYLVMDYCNGGELFFHLKQARSLVITPPVRASSSSTSSRHVT